jgi:uncharacterized membrane protein
MADTEALGARQALLLMAQTLVNIASSGNPTMMIAVCDSLALAMSNPDWTLPAEVWAAKRSGLN